MKNASQRSVDPKEANETKMAAVEVRRTIVEEEEAAAAVTTTVVDVDVRATTTRKAKGTAGTRGTMGTAEAAVAAEGRRVKEMAVDRVVRSLATCVDKRAISGKTVLRRRETRTGLQRRRSRGRPA